MKDPIVKSLVERYQTRSDRGIAKYGTTLHENNTDNYFKHLLEELMDASLYLEKIIHIIQTEPNDAALGEKIRDLVRGKV